METCFFREILSTFLAKFDRHGTKLLSLRPPIRAMSKRKAPELTGGTGDVNPQWFSFVVLQTGNDAETTNTVDLPISPGQVSRGNKAVVIELLRVQFIWSLDPTQSPSIPQRWAALLGTRAPVGALSASQSATDHIITDQFATIQAGAGSTVLGRQASLMYDLTDGVGHGLIIASKSVAGHISTFNTGIANRVVIRMLYRYKEVGLTEFLTMSQFQS